MRAQHVLNYHLIKVPWVTLQLITDQNRRGTKPNNFTKREREIDTDKESDRQTERHIEIQKKRNRQKRGRKRARKI